MLFVYEKCKGREKR